MILDMTWKPPKNDPEVIIGTFHDHGGIPAPTDDRRLCILINSRITLIHLMATIRI